MIHHEFFILLQKPKNFTFNSLPKEFSRFRAEGAPISKMFINRSPCCFSIEIGSFEIFEIRLEMAEWHHDLHRVSDCAELEKTAAMV